jgi:hypothetical protein
MRIVKEAVYTSIFGVSVCQESCGKNNNNQHESSSGTPEDGITSEMDSVESQHTIMPAI